MGAGVDSAGDDGEEDLEGEATVGEAVGGVDGVDSC